jgi:hypothetical protein
MKPTPLGKTYLEYETEVKEYNLAKTELAMQKVNLSLANDLKGVLNGIENDSIYDVYSKTIQISSNLEILKEKAKERFNTNEKVVQASVTRIKLAEKYLATSKSVSKELGIDETAIPNYNNVLTAKTKLQNTIKSLSSVQNKLKNLINK